MDTLDRPPQTSRMSSRNHLLEHLRTMRREGRLTMRGMNSLSQLESALHSQQQRRHRWPALHAEFDSRERALVDAMHAYVDRRALRPCMLVRKPGRRPGRGD
jgi:hypothetical protein